MIVPLNRYQLRHQARARAPLPLPHMFFDTTNLCEIFSQLHVLNVNLAKTLQVLTRDNSFPCGDRETFDLKDKLRTEGGVCKDLSCQKNMYGRGRGARARA